MLNIYASNPEEAYALEELHDYMGIIIQSHVSIIVGAAEKNTFKNDSEAFIRFVRNDDHLMNKIDYNIQENRLTINSNALDFIWQTLSRKNEHSQAIDEHYRPKLTDDFAYKNNLHRVPYLDNLLGKLTKIIHNFLESRKIGWQRHSPLLKPTVCLTHDVDGMHGKNFGRYAAWLLKSATTGKMREVKKCIYRIRKYIKDVDDPLFPVESFVSKKNGIKRTFFVMSLPFLIGGEGLRYSVNRESVRTSLSVLLENGHEIALHPSKRFHTSKPAASREILRLQRSLPRQYYLRGARNHYLRGSFPGIWNQLEDTGLGYDSSMGWVEDVGFRCGTSRPFRAFDYIKKTVLKVWELPLIVMDGAIRGDKKQIFETVKKMSDECFSHGSPITILWHTNRISEIDYPEHSQAYAELVKYFETLGCKGVTASELVDLYKKHHEIMAKNRRIVSLG